MGQRKRRQHQTRGRDRLLLGRSHQPRVVCSRHSKTVKAGVVRGMGRLVGAESVITPAHPVELAARLKAPVLGLYGGQDGGIPLTTVNQMKDALAAAGAKGNKAAKAFEFVVYSRFSPMYPRRLPPQLPQRCRRRRIRCRWFRSMRMACSAQLGL